MPARVTIVSTLLVVVSLAGLVSAQLPFHQAKIQSQVSIPPSLSQRINGILSEPQVAKGFWGVEVEDLASGKALYEHDSEKLFVPASNTKLFTTASALGLIGPDFKFSTTVETSGKLDRPGHVVADLILKGRGDPNLSGRSLPYRQKTERRFSPDKVLEELTDQIVKNGVRYVEGDLIGDDSYYAFERFGEGWAQDDLLWDYGAPVSALSINDNVIFLNISPGKRSGDAAFISLDPAVPYYQIENKVITTSTGAQNISINREPGSKRLYLAGSIPLADNGYHASIAVEDPAEFAAIILRDLLRARGVVIRGIARARHADPGHVPSGGLLLASPSSATPGIRLVLATHESQPLLEDIAVTDKVSQNLHAELLLRLLGAIKGRTADVAGGLEVVRGFVSLAGITSEDLALYDGSGLSRRTLVSPHAVVKLLQYIVQQPWGASFQEALPVAGVDGSLSERLTEPAIRGRVRAKTGTLGHVNALSGYAQTASGRQLVFSILSNNHNLTSKQATAVIDDVVRAIVDDKTYSLP